MGLTCCYRPAPHPTFHVPKAIRGILDAGSDSGRWEFFRGMEGIEGAVEAMVAGICVCSDSDEDVIDDVLGVILREIAEEIDLVVDVKVLRWTFDR